MNFRELYHSGLYVQIARHMVNVEVLLKRQLFHLVDESNIGENCLTRCCMYGHLDLLKRLLKTHKGWYLGQVACLYGQLDTLKYLKEINYDCCGLVSYPEFGKAEEGQQMHIIKYLYQQLKDYNFEPRDLLMHAVERGWVLVVKCIYEDGIRLIEDLDNIFEHCINERYVELLKYLYLEHPGVYGYSCFTSIFLDEVEMFKILWDGQNYQQDLIIAAECGSIDIIKYLCEEVGVEFDKDEIMNSAMNYNNFNIVEYIENYQRTK